MLAALLCNLEEEIRQERNGFVEITFAPGDRSTTARRAAKRIEELMFRPADLPRPVKNRADKVKRKVIRAVREAARLEALDEFPLEQIAETGRLLSMAVFELKQSMVLIQPVLDELGRARMAEMVALLEQMQRVLDEDESVLVLLLST